MKLKKLGLVMSILAMLSFILPTQAAALSDPGGVSAGDASGGSVSEGDASGGSVSEGDASGGSVSEGDASGGDEKPDESDADLSGKTVNLSLVIDTTGSMGSYISDVITNLSEFVRFVESTGVNFRISLVDYRDITCDEETVVHTFDHSVWSQDTEQLIKEMESLSADGGGDGPETVIDALGYVVDESVMTFNSDAAKFVIVLTDADYKLDNTHGIMSMDDMISRLKAKGIRVSVMTEEYNFPVYEGLTKETGGILCPVTNFEDALREYALSIINATADSETDTSIKPVDSITATGSTALHPNYVYEYSVKISPADATDKGVLWYTEDGDVAEIVSVSGTNCYVRGASEGSTKVVAVSRDGGYTSSIDITVSNDAPVSDSVAAYDYDVIKDALSRDSVKTFEYRLVDSNEVNAVQQKEIMSSIQGKEKTFSFAFSDGTGGVMYKWSFLGTNIVDPDCTIDFTIKPNAGTVLPAVETENPDESSLPKADVHFEHDGKLPGKASIEVAFGTFFDSVKELYLYYYNPERGGLELAADHVPVVDGIAKFPLEHCSDYILSVAVLRSLIPLPKSDVSTSEGNSTEESTIESTSTPVSPKTGEDSFMWLYVAIIIGSLGGAVICSKKLSVRER